jgi:uncharacterized Zn-binding protein involved in type VI secretion
MLDLSEKIRALEKKHGDLRSGRIGKETQARKDQFKLCYPMMGQVVDNKDPESIGRIRVSQDMVSPGSISEWLPIVGQWKKKESGWWTLPELGTQALVVYTKADRSEGYVLGFIYDEKHTVAKRSSEKATGSTILQTKKHRIEIIEEKDKEEIRIESKAGQMRCLINKKGGIQIVNELGDINIKCRNIKVESEKEIYVGSKKTVKAESEDEISVKSKKEVIVESEKEVKLKGKNIKMSGSKGITATNKQIAKQNDKVIGFDTHIMVIPAGTSTANVPLPHPFIGQIKDKVSSDVKIGDKGVATKGSIAKHDDSMHMQLPGTIKFQNNPKKEGEVTGGTVSKVKVNGKEVAVLGSQVTTCNDMGMQNNSTIVSIGASIPMPAIINPANTEEYKREQEEAEKKEPKFGSVKWSKTSCEEGEEIELIASVEDITDGNMVTLQVFPEGSGPESGRAYAKFPLIVKDGSVSAKWKYKADQRELPPENNPKFIFTAHSAWCNFEKSSNTLEVKLIRPEITKAEWKDSEGKTTNKGLVGEPLKLVAETKDMEGGVTFWIYDDKGREVTSIGAEIKGDKAEAEWTYHWNGEKLDAKPKFTFEVTGQRCKRVESGECEIGATFEAVLQNQNGEILKDLDYAIIQSDDSTSDSKTDDNGIIKVEDVIPGIVEVKVSFEDIESSYVVNFSTEESNSNDEIILQPNEKTLLASKPINVNKKIIFIFYTEELDVSE